jgi:pyruvate,orthophosphate dikinase
MKKIKDEMANVFEFFTEKFGYMPLLSVRSGARASMPGMMDTILNVGLTSANFPAWVERLGQDCADNCSHRLTDMYGSTVLGYGPQMISDTAPFVPESAEEQVLNCIEAVFKSWDNDRAKFYRKMNNIPEDWGTAVTVQAMVFGNLNENSGTGVLFTRNPDSGENVITGEFLANAQGEDVVAGTATPLPLSQLTLWNKKVSAELLETVAKLEYLKSEVQDVEFTIQDGQLYILQTRNAKRSAKAAVKTWSAKK